MTDAEPPPSPTSRASGPIEPAPFGAGLRQAALFVYAIVALALLGLALYMGGVAGRPLTSGYVIAPAIGAMWFGLRVFMILGSRK